MEKRLRSSAPAELPHAVPSHKKPRNDVQISSLDWSRMGVPSRDDILGNIRQVLGIAPRNLWLYMYPDSDQYFSFYKAVGIKWEELLPAFLESKLVGYAKGGSLCFELEKWGGLAIPGSDLRIFTTTYRPRGEQRQPFICIGKPIHKNPINQAKANESGSSRVFPETRALRESRRSLRAFFRDTQASLLVNEIDATVDELSQSEESQEEAKMQSVGCGADTSRLQEPSTPAAGVYRNIVTPATVCSPNPAMNADQQIATSASPATPDLPTPLPKPQRDPIELWEANINFAWHLDMDRRPRLTRCGTREIELHERKQADGNTRALALNTAMSWGWKNERISYKQRLRIAQAACNQVSYDLGYKRPISWTRLPVWGKDSDTYILTGDLSKLEPQYKGSTSYTDRIEEQHPGYIRELFRYAQRTVGYQASFLDLANCMDEKSSNPAETRDSLALHPSQLNRWFLKNNGKEKAASEKPRLTVGQMRKRVIWCRKYLKMLADNVPFAFLDEKWFYTTSRRRKVKFLPPTDDERAADPSLGSVKRPKVVSRRNVQKVMYLGVVANPMLEHGFNGAVYLQRVAEDRARARASKNQRFSDDGAVNHALKENEWHNLYTPQMTFGELAGIIAESHGLEEEIADRLRFEYKTFSGKRGKTVSQPVLMNKCVEDYELRRPNVPDAELLTIHDIEVKVHYEKGETMKKDVSCDSNFMKRVMPEVGAALRQKFSWVAANEPIYLVMDNAGGHGTDKAVEEYTTLLRSQFKVIIVQQVPRSPETNLLDLGIWRSIQAAVEKAHAFKCHEADALARTVESVWENNLSAAVFGKVYQRLLKVLKLIYDDNGGNQTVEEKRGKLFSDPVYSLDEEELGSDLQGGQHIGVEEDLVVEE